MRDVNSKNIIIQRDEPKQAQKSWWCRNMKLDFYFLRDWTF